MPQLCSEGNAFDHIRESWLQSLLGKQKLLIVLGDLYHYRFLQYLLNWSGPNVKYLVTSQLGDICKHLNCSYVKISIEEDLHGPNKKEISRKLLSVHIGYSTYETIPDNLQKIADKILGQAQGNPLVIATLGAQIAKADDHEDDQAVWESVSDSFFQCLEEETPSKCIHGIAYGKSYWSVLKQSIESLGHKEKQMLFVMSMCKGPSIPQAVVFFLFSSICPEGNSSVKHSSQMIAELKSRQLLSKDSKKHLTIHLLTKSCILEKMSKHTNSIAQAFIDIDSELWPTSSRGFVTKATVICVLACLYLDDIFASPVANGMGYSLESFSKSKEVAIQSITQVLATDLQWTKELYQSAGQVFINFVCSDSLCIDHLTRLLQCPTWVTPTLEFLQSSSAVGKSFWRKNSIYGILSVFERIIGDSHHPHIQVQGAQTLKELVRHRANAENILSASSLLHQLVNLMSQGVNNDIQCSAVGFFVSCSHSNNDNPSLQKLVNFLPLLPALVDSLADNQNAHLQRLSANVLHNLACTTHSQTLLQMLSYSPLLQRLVASLRKRFNPQLQVSATLAILNLAGNGSTQLIREQIASHPELLDNLEISLDQDDNSCLPFWAARALIKLAWTKDTSKLLRILADSLEVQQDPYIQERATRSLTDLALVSNTTKIQILNFPGLLENLVKSLNNDVNPGLQTQAARALVNLTSSKDPCISIQILRSTLLLESLTSSLRKQFNHQVQVYAARVIDNLAEKDSSQLIREQIASHPGLLDNLETSLDEDDNSCPRSRLPLWAARALIKLAWTKDTSKLLRILANALEVQKDADLQTRATYGLADLAMVNDTTKNQILNFGGLLVTLDKSLHNDVNPGLQTQAARVLLNLASSKYPCINIQILSSLLLLGSLAPSLRTQFNHQLQVNATWAIAYLAAKGSDSPREQIASHLKLLDNLETSLDQDELRVWEAKALIKLACIKDTSKLLRILAESLEVKQDFDLQKAAARSLASLAHMSSTIKNQILNFPGLLETLIKSLDNDVNSGLQIEVARALLNLTSSEDLCINIQILSSPLLLGSLAALLRKQFNCQLQMSVASTIAYLASKGSDQPRMEWIITHPWLPRRVQAPKYPRLISRFSPHARPLNHMRMRGLHLQRYDGRISRLPSREGPWPRLLDNLETSLDQDDNPHLQVWAARALTKLAWTKDTCKLLQILAESLEEKQDLDLQKAAARCLVHITFRNDAMKFQSLSCLGLLENVVKLLNDYINQDLQVEVARALVNLASVKQMSMKAQLFNSLSLLNNVVSSLRKHHNPALQLEAAGIIANLVGEGADKAMRNQIWNCQGLVDDLEKFLDQNDNPELCVLAACALVNSAPNVGTSKLLEILAVSLERKQDLIVRVEAAVGLGDLAFHGDNVIKDQILTFPGLLDNLESSLDEGEGGGQLQEFAARAFVKLSSSHDSLIKTKLLHSPFMLQKLVASMGKAQDRALQWNAVSAIVNLSSVDGEVAQEMMHSAGLVDALVKLLDHEKSLQAKAALALSNLSHQLDATMQAKIAHLLSTC